MPGPWRHETGVLASLSRPDPVQFGACLWLEWVLTSFNKQRRYAAMFYAAPKPLRSWGVIAAEFKLQSDPTDPTRLLKLVEELNRAMAEQGVESAASVSANSSSALLRTA
jgi:hypothetical protein